MSPTVGGWGCHKAAVGGTCPCHQYKGGSGQSPPRPRVLVVSPVSCAMRPCLLIALALLGTVPVSRSALASPAVEDEEDVTELEMPEEYSGCRGASDKQALGVPSMPGTATCRYVVISRCRTFRQAQRICARRYCGRLASIHDSRTNAFLLHLARRNTNAGLVWIGAVSQPAVRTLPPWPRGTLSPPRVPSAHPGCPSPVPRFPVHSLRSPIPFPVLSVPTKRATTPPPFPSAHLGAPALSQYP
ncbi:uncharacterized protein LOC120501022 isoform X1 [Passer montanus]|uniref:uncharacterized protein LOC120501022 isoform X1 n=1 Tax=Passer montanus TaxID=9160 RepID=UPI0019607C01|nr:uncharacterized protein LOC120501022 isoform X1 [Passer montanus]